MTISNKLFMSQTESKSLLCLFNLPFKSIYFPWRGLSYRTLGFNIISELANLHSFGQHCNFKIKQTWECRDLLKTPIHILLDK